MYKCTRHLNFRSAAAPMSEEDTKAEHHPGHTLLLLVARQFVIVLAVVNAQVARYCDHTYVALHPKKNAPFPQPSELKEMS